MLERNWRPKVCDFRPVPYIVFVDIVVTNAKHSFHQTMKMYISSPKVLNCLLKNMFYSNSLITKIMVPTLAFILEAVK